MRKVNKILACVLILLTLLPNTAFAQSSEEVRELDRIKILIEPYLGSDENGKPYFNREEAVNAGLDIAALEAADGVYEIMCTYYNYENGIQTRMSVPLYGNWCGPEYGSGTPIDLLDEGCRQHDQCYGRYYYHKCSCDVQLVSYIDRNIGKMSGAQKTAAGLVRNWASIKSSNVTSTGGNFSCRP